MDLRHAPLEGPFHSLPACLRASTGVSSRRLNRRNRLFIVEAIPIRAHNLLCLLGFRGEGYSVHFVSEMWDVHRTLSENPLQRVLVLNTPDRLCGACPNLRMGGCTLQGPNHETHMRSQDEDVLSRLGLEAGEAYTWAEILTRIAASVRGGDLPGICTTCPWLHLGWCAEGIDRLRSKAAAVVEAPTPL